MIARITSYYRYYGIVIILQILFFFSLPAQNSTGTNLYSGGMLVYQQGYTISSNPHQSIEGFSFGLGGILRFYLNPHLTAGLYGGTQRVGYDSRYAKGSYLHLGYGGGFFGYSRRVQKVRFSASVFLGMGKIRNLHIEKRDGSILSEAYQYQNSTLVYSPLLSFDYSLTERIWLTAQTVFLHADFDSMRKYRCPVFQLGVLFSR